MPLEDKLLKHLWPSKWHDSIVEAAARVGRAGEAADEARDGAADESC